MKKIRNFLSPLPKHRKVAVVIFSGLILLSTLVSIAVLVIYLLFEDSPTLNDETLLTYLIGFTFILWFISCMGFSISSNVQSKEEIEERRASQLRNYEAYSARNKEQNEQFKNRLKKIMK